MRGVMKRVMLSTIDTSMSWPTPVRWRWNSAAVTARDASVPDNRSAAGVPTFCGSRPASPVRSITPL